MNANTLSRKIAKAGFEYDRAQYNPSSVRGHGTWKSGFRVRNLDDGGAVVDWITCGGREFPITLGKQNMPKIADAIRAMGYSVEIIPTDNYNHVIGLIVKEAI
jgi:hypothetical protein